MYADAQATIGYLQHRHQIEYADLVIHGWSIGSAPALESAVQLEKVAVGIKGVVLQCPISSTYKAARAHGENPLAAAIGHKMFGMNNDKKIKQLKATPVLILKGSTDNQGFQDMADHLHESCGSVVNELETFIGGHEAHAAIFRNDAGAALTRFCT